ncbi:uncharacterized protein RSE6_12351 [Rhynchosporium secalis]|uniref:Uncharacterized protein n=1 Tax=Rhynchosporium secalis TaxID=38038 RepID=A0A1E1MQ87_RHYSE|nr:uncharacterized protein RSE6_12351 [Rhynchosporium secalis]
MLLSFWTLIAFLGLILGFPVPAPLLSRTLSPKGLTTREVDLNTFLSLLLNHLPPPCRRNANRPLRHTPVLPSSPPPPTILKPLRKTARKEYNTPTLSYYDLKPYRNTVLINYEYPQSR